MKVGDLVKIREGGSGLVWDGEIPPDAVGIVVEEPRICKLSASPLHVASPCLCSSHGGENAESR